MALEGYPDNYILPNPELKHLNQGVKPIMACIGIPRDFGLKGYVRLDKNRKGVDNIDFSGAPSDLEERGMKNAGYETYVISAMNDHDKASEYLRNCTTLVVAGVDSKTGKDISFMTHQNPRKFLNELKTAFLNDLSERLEEAKARCLKGTIDAVITGGNSFDDGSDYQKNYFESVKLLTKEVETHLGFEPAVVAGPKTVGGGDFIFYAAINRGLYIVRPDEMRGRPSNAAFKPGEIERDSKNWYPDARS